MNTLIPLTAVDLLQAGHWFQRGERQFEITAWDAQQPLRVEARSAETGEPASFTLPDLFDPAAPVRFAPTRAGLAHPPAGATAPGRVVDAASLPAHLLQRADRIIQTVEAVQAQIEHIQQRCQLISEPFSLTKATLQACQAIPTPVSFSHYYVHRRLYLAHAGDEG
jgi:hypothetical protein